MELGADSARRGVGRRRLDQCNDNNNNLATNVANQTLANRRTPNGERLAGRAKYEWNISRRWLQVSGHFH